MAVGNRVSADLSVMGTVSNKFGTDYEQLQSYVTALQNECDTVVSTWRGAASGAFVQVKAEVDAAWTALNAVLDEISSNIAVSQTNYGNTDSNNASGYSRVPTTGITTSLTQV
jgi:WXG100 family type VII secretion target